MFPLLFPHELDFPSHRPFSHSDICAPLEAPKVRRSFVKPWKLDGFLPKDSPGKLHPAPSFAVYKSICITIWIYVWTKITSKGVFVGKKRKCRVAIGDQIKSPSFWGWTLLKKVFLKKKLCIVIHPDGFGWNVENSLHINCQPWEDVAAASSNPWWLFRCFFYHRWFIIPPVLSSEIWHISWEVLPIFFEEDFCSDDLISNSDYKSGGCVFLYKPIVTVTFSCVFFSTGRLFPRKPIQNLPRLFDGGMDPTLEVRWQPKKDTVTLTTGDWNPAVSTERMYQTRGK